MELIEGQRGEPGPRRIDRATSSPEERGGRGVRAHHGRRPPHQIWP